MEASVDTQREQEIKRVAEKNRKAGSYVETLDAPDVIILDIEPDDDPAQAAKTE